MTWTKDTLMKRLDKLSGEHCYDFQVRCGDVWHTMEDGDYDAAATLFVEALEIIGEPDAE